MTITLQEEVRILGYCRIGDGCWEWDGAHDSDGYGVAWFENRTQGAHRAVYKILVGDIPDGFQLDHRCRNRGCVKPEELKHTEPATQFENNLRGNSPSAINARKTHCINDHEFTEDNTYVTPKGQRYCRACMRARSKAYQLRKKGGGSLG